MIIIYHNHDFLDFRYYLSDKVATLINPVNLLKVAEVDTDDLNIAWRLTQHIESNWTKNEGVKSYYEHIRSTSVGDVIVCDDRGWVIAPIGFDELAKNIVDYLNT